MFEKKVILLGKSISELVIKLDTFMCMDNSEDNSIDHVVSKLTVLYFERKLDGPPTFRVVRKCLT